MPYSKIKIIISASLTALILFLFCRGIHASLPLTETIYTIPESEITLSFHEEIWRLDTGGNFRREIPALGLGILPGFSIWYSLDYLHKNIIDTSANRIGDSFLKFWIYLGDYYRIFHTGLLLNFRIPTGPNAYTENEWRNISFGNHELKIGPVFKIDITKSIFIHANMFYVFRQSKGEDFYGGFYFNVLKKETYSKLFGLNFRAKDTFMEGGRLKNDYAVYSMAINTDAIYPIIPFMELYISHRVYKKQNEKYDNIPIEGSGINPVLLSAGGRYFFTEKIFIGLYYISNPKREKKYIKDIFGFDFSLQF